MSIACTVSSLNVSDKETAEGGKPKTRVIDLDVDIGADAVDYKYVTFVSNYCYTYLGSTVLLRTKNLCQHWRLKCASLRELSKR